MNAIQINGVSKKYGEVQALDQIDLSVRKGELFGLIGPDGAGKTSLIRILTTLLKPSAGTATVEDMDVVAEYRRIRQVVGYMPGRFSLYQDLTVLENLEFFASIFGASVEANYDLIKDIYQQIEPFRHRRAGNLSGGMKQKLALSCALIHKPLVLFLDEPTTGVDAVSRKEFWEMLKRLKEKGITTFVSTPYMDEAVLCDRVALIQNGKILSVDSPEGIMEAYDLSLLAVSSDQPFRLIRDLRAYPGTYSAFSFGDAIHLTSREELSAGSVENYLEEKGHTSIRVQAAQPDIEDCFMYLMKKN